MRRIISLFRFDNRSRPLIILSFVCLGLLCVPRAGFAEGERVDLVGEFQYTYGDHQTPDQARQIAYTMAVRKAIEAYPVFLEDTSPIKDPAVIKAVIQTLSSGYLHNLEIVEQKEEGRTVFCKVKASIEPGVFKTVLTRELNRLIENKAAEVIDENKYIRILSVTDYPVEDTRRKKTVKEIKVVYQQVTSDSTQILIDFYDAKGKPLMGKRSTTQEFLLPGEIRQVVFTMPDDARSYRVWLRK